jgi:tetratricopeptide (TPR) repeat protein
MLSVVLAALLFGCGSGRPYEIWTGSFLEAEDTWSRHGTIEPADRFLELAKAAPSEESKRRALFAHARSLAAHDDGAAATVFFGDLENGSDRVAAEAAYQRSTLDGIFSERPGRRQRLGELIARYPDTVAAERFLMELVWDHRDTSDHEELLGVLERLQARTSGTLIEARMAFEKASHAHHYLKRPSLALSTYAALHNLNPTGSLADDALWEMGVVYGGLQMWSDYVDVLKRLDRARESSWFVGHYRSGWQHKARYQLGLVHLIFLDDYDAARHYFQSYLEDFPDNTLADDAAWNLVEVKRLAGHADYSASRERFVRAFPWSRHARRARKSEVNKP